MNHVKHTTLVSTFTGYAVPLFVGVIATCLLIAYSADAVAADWRNATKSFAYSEQGPIFFMLMKQAGIAAATLFAIGFSGIYRGLGRMPSYHHKNYRFSMRAGLAASLSATTALCLPFLIAYSQWYVDASTVLDFESGAAFASLLTEPAMLIGLTFIALQAVVALLIIVRMHGIERKQKALTIAIAIVGITLVAAIGYALVFHYGWDIF